MSNEELELPDIKRKQRTINVRCEQCIYLTRYAVYGKPCSELGSTGSSLPCNNFSLDPSKLARRENFARTLRILSENKNAAAVAAALVYGKRVARFGFTLGEVVYFKLADEDFLSNYAGGYVFGCSKNMIVVAGKDGFTAILSPKSLLKLETFERKRAKLIKNKRINDPKGYARVTLKGDRVLTYLPEIASKKSKSIKAKTKVTPTTTRGRRKKIVISA